MLGDPYVLLQLIADWSLGKKTEEDPSGYSHTAPNQLAAMVPNGSKYLEICLIDQGKAMWKNQFWLDSRRQGLLTTGYWKQLNSGVNWPSKMESFRSSCKRYFLLVLYHYFLLKVHVDCLKLVSKIPSNDNRISWFLMISWSKCYQQLEPS